MKMKRFVLALSVFCTTAALIHGQPPAAPVFTQTINYVKVAPGKGADYMKFVAATTMKVAQMRADAGEILSWTLLRSVYPAGQEARSDYMISTITEGGPRAAAEATTQRTALSSLVASEVWRPRIRLGAPAKGHYIFINYMKVHDAAKYAELERTYWGPMSEEMIKQGSLSGWIFATKTLPSGTDTTYTAYTADMFASWDAAFKTRPTQAVFEKVAPGKNFDATMTEIGKQRDLARRELWVVVERVTKK